jgi:hypothetical protein
MSFLLELKAETNLSAVVNRYGIDFISFHMKGLAHRLLRTPLNKREGKTVESLIVDCRYFADALVPDNTFDPYKDYRVRLAKHIDSNRVFRAIFLGLKKIYPKPIYS